MRYPMRVLKRRREPVLSALAFLFVWTTTTTVGAQIGVIAETQPATSASPEQDTRFRLVETIEPGRIGTFERLPVYLRFFQREMISDPRIFAFHVEAMGTDEGAVRLTGYVEFEEHRDSLEAFLGDLGFDRIDNRVEVLPAKELGLLRYGLVKTTHSLCRAAPTPDAEVLTDSLLGEPLFLLK